MPDQTAPAAPLLDPAAVVADVLAAAPVPPPAAAPAPASAPTSTAPTSPASPAAAAIVDRSGRAFDPTHHKTNADGSPFVNRLGYFMPRGGRPKKADAPATDTPPAADPAAAWTAADRAAAAMPSEPAPGGNPAPDEMPPPPASAQAAGPAADATATAEQAGDVLARAVYMGTGAMIGDHAAAEATGAEHKNLKDLIGAFLEHRGIRFVGWVALAVGFVAYLTGERRREKVVKAIAGPARPAPAVTPAQPAPPAPPAPRETPAASTAPAPSLQPAAPMPRAAFIDQTV